MEITEALHRYSLLTSMRSSPLRYTVQINSGGQNETKRNVFIKIPATSFSGFTQFAHTLANGFSEFQAHKINVQLYLQWHLFSLSLNV